MLKIETTSTESFKCSFLYVDAKQFGLFSKAKILKLEEDNNGHLLAHSRIIEKLLKSTDWYKKIKFSNMKPFDTSPPKKYPAAVQMKVFSSKPVSACKAIDGSLFA